jgi:hypothetical protein
MISVWRRGSLRFQTVGRGRMVVRRSVGVFIRPAVRRWRVWFM